MNFTREPVIETILSPKDGYKLCIKNSKIVGSEELFVDAIEVVSFGHAFFFRGQEKPKPFLVPVTDYEIFEVKETRVVLKNASHERNIKIGGGREAFAKPPKEQVAKEPLEEEVGDKEIAVSSPQDGKHDKKRERRRNRRRRGTEEKKEPQEEALLSDQGHEDVCSEETCSEENSVKSTPAPTMMFAQLLPPPTTLISESLAKIRAREQAALLEALPVEGPMTALHEERESFEEDDFF